jgi:hypothetical protein
MAAREAERPREARAKPAEERAASSAAVEAARTSPPPPRTQTPKEKHMPLGISHGGFTKPPKARGARSIAQKQPRRFTATQPSNRDISKYANKCQFLHISVNFSTFFVNFSTSN